MVVGALPHFFLTRQKLKREHIDILSISLFTLSLLAVISPWWYLGPWAPLWCCDSHASPEPQHRLGCRRATHKSGASSTASPLKFPCNSAGSRQVVTSFLWAASPSWGSWWAFRCPYWRLSTDMTLCCRLPQRTVECWARRWEWVQNPLSSLNLFLPKQQSLKLFYSDIPTTIYFWFNVYDCD